ncbi:MAG: type II/IV secretion system ATPase subunit [archaeon]
MPAEEDKRKKELREILAKLEGEKKEFIEEFKPVGELTLPEKVESFEIPKEALTISSDWEPPKIAEVDERYTVIEPYTFVSIKWDKDANELKYLVAEPPLSEAEKKKYEFIKKFVVDVLDLNISEIRNLDEIKNYLRRKVDDLIADYEIVYTESEYNKIMYYIARDFIGFGKIEPLMQDAQIEDISCDGVGIPVFVYHRKYGSLKTNIVFEDAEELNHFISKLAQRCGRHISVAEPLLDGALPDGSRLQATLSVGKDIAMKGSTFTIRKFTKDPLTIVDFIKFGTIPPLIAAYLWMAIEFRNSILISGGTATGKTSCLNALSLFIHPETKIISIEDTPEINLPHVHWVAKVARAGYGAEKEGKKFGEVSMFDLLKAALRERPEVLIVGEVRGAEAYVLFQGMATGHQGLATIHAESVDAVMNRLTTPPIQLPPGLLQHLNLVLILTFARIKGMEVRRIKEIVEIVGFKEGKLETNTLIKWVPSKDEYEFASRKSYLLNKISTEKGISHESIWSELNRRVLVLDWMRKNNIRNYKEVGNIISMYYKNPVEILKKIHGA